MVRVLLIGVLGFMLGLEPALALARPANPDGPDFRPRVQPRWRGVAPIAGGQPVAEDLKNSASVLSDSCRQLGAEVASLGASGLEQRAAAIRQQREEAAQRRQQELAHQEQEKKDAAAAAQQKRLADEAAAKRLQEQQAAAAAEEQKRAAYQAEQKRIADQAAAQLKAQQEAEARRQAQLAEQQRLADEAARKKAAEQARLEQQRTARLTQITSDFGASAAQPAVKLAAREQQRLLDLQAKQRADAERQRLADEARQRSAAEAQARADAEAKSKAAAEAKARADAEAQRQRVQAARAQAQQLAPAWHGDAQRVAQAEQQRLLDLAAKRRAEEEQRRLADETAKRQAAEEQKRKDDEARQARLLAEQRRADEQRRKDEAARQRRSSIVAAYVQVASGVGQQVVASEAQRLADLEQQHRAEERRIADAKAQAAAEAKARADAAAKAKAEADAREQARQSEEKRLADLAAARQHQQDEEHAKLLADAQSRQQSAPAGPAVDTSGSAPQDLGVVPNEKVAAAEQEQKKRIADEIRERIKREEEEKARKQQEARDRQAAQQKKRQEAAKNQNGEQSAPAPQVAPAEAQSEKTPITDDTQPAPAPAEPAAPVDPPAANPPADINKNVEDKSAGFRVKREKQQALDKPPLPTPPASSQPAAQPPALPEAAPPAATALEDAGLTQTTGGPLIEVMDGPAAPTQIRPPDPPQAFLPGGKMLELSCGLPTRKQVALTFDDGPHPQYTSQLLAILAQYHVPATFFEVGIQAQKYPQWVKMTAQAGNEIGNHTYDHFRLTDLPTDERLHQIDAMNDLCTQLTGHKPLFLRPPGGEVDEDTEKLIASRGMVCAMWDINLNDTAQGKTKDELLNTAMKKVHNGSIIEAHDGIQATIDMLPDLITRLKAQGYEFVTLSQMCQGVDAAKLSGKHSKVRE